MKELLKMYKGWREKRREIARQKFGDWFFKKHKKEIDEMLEKIDLDVKDIKITK